MAVRYGKIAMTEMHRRLLPSTSALAAFDAVARLGSFSAAAEALSLTQGAISRQIAVLEAQLGVQLFHRSSRGVALSDPGRAYADSIRPALAGIRAASLEVMTNQHGNGLKLAILPTFGTRWLMPRIPAFVARHPQITISFATRIGRFDFATDGIDAAIHIGTPDWPDADCTFLMTETVAPVASPAFLAAHPVRDAADLQSLPLLHMMSRPGAWRHWFESLSLPAAPSGGMQFEQFSTVAQACAAGLGVALMPLFLIRPELGSGQLVPAFDHPVESPSAYYLVSPHTRRAHKPVEAFRSWITEEVHAFVKDGEATLA